MVNVKLLECGDDVISLSCFYVTMIADKHVQEAWSLTEGWSADLQQVGNNKYSNLRRDSKVTLNKLFSMSLFLKIQVHTFSVSPARSH